MALSVDDKKRIVADISSFANDSSSLVLADARGLNVSEATGSRSHNRIIVKLKGYLEKNQ